MSGSLSDAILAFASSGAGAGVAIWLLKRFFMSYLDEKGKNLATKEDIASITHEVERVRLEYSALLEQTKARHQLRLAALDRRLAAHQEAFTHWRELFTADASDMEGVAKKCRDWWNRNCLYLEPAVRQAFLDAVSQEYRDRARRTPGHDHATVLADHMGKMFAFPNILFEAIQLPRLTAAEVGALGGSAALAKENG